MTTSDEAIAALERAFADVPRPSDAELLHPEAFDDGDLQGLYPYADWRDVPDEVLEREYTALSFLSADGFRCFIAAYLRFALRHPESGAAAVDSTIWAFVPDMYRPDLAAFVRSKYERLEKAQRRAIELALESLTVFSDLDADRALTAWRAKELRP
jgi:hypothetical protein